MVAKLGEYKYSSYNAFSEQKKVVECLKTSFVFEDYKDVNERLEFIKYVHDDRILDERNKITFEANKEGFLQHSLSTILGMSQTQVSRIIKKQRV